MPAVPKPAPRARMKLGQRSRKPINKVGRIGKLWRPFQQQVLGMWFDQAVAAGARVEEVHEGTVRVAVDRKTVPGDVAQGYIQRFVGLGGRAIYRGFDVEVGHKEGRGKDRHPEDRHNPEAVEPQSHRYNSQMETIAQARAER